MKTKTTTFEFRKTFFFYKLPPVSLSLSLRRLLLFPFLSTAKRSVLGNHADLLELARPLRWRARGARGPPPFRLWPPWTQQRPQTQFVEIDSRHRAPCGLDDGPGVGRDGADLEVERDGQFLAFAQQLDPGRRPVGARPGERRQLPHRQRPFLGGRVRQLPLLDRGLDGTHVERGPFNGVRVVKAPAREPLGERGLPPLEAQGGGGARAGPLALVAAGGGLSPAGPDPSADAPGLWKVWLGFWRWGGGVEKVEIEGLRLMRKKRARQAADSKRSNVLLANTYLSPPLGSLIKFQFSSALCDLKHSFSSPGSWTRAKGRCCSGARTRRRAQTIAMMEATPTTPVTMMMLRRQ